MDIMKTVNSIAPDNEKAGEIVIHLYYLYFSLGEYNEKKIDVTGVALIMSITG
jgi:hypothetical protein